MRRAILVALLALIAIGCKGSSKTKPPPSADDSVVAAWRSDLALVARELTTHHPQPFHKVTEADFKAAVAALDRDIPTMTNDQRLVGLAKVIALVGEGHTNLQPNPMAYMLVTPMLFRWFADGIFVVAAAEPYASAVGARLVAIEDRPIDEVATALSAAFGWEVEGFRRKQVAFLLTFLAALRGAGLAPAEGPLHLRLVARDGAPLELAVEPQTWRPPPEANPPPHRAHLAANYWHEYRADTRTLYVQYNKCEEGRQLPFAAFTEQVTAILDHQPVERLVIDLRYNTGGSDVVFRPMVAAIEARPALRGRVFALIGPTTFSSAIFATVALDRAGALVVGEPAGSAASHYGEVHWLPLPGTGNKLGHSTKWHDLPGYPDTALPPELAAPETSADYFAGRDPAMAAVLAQPVPFP